MPGATHLPLWVMQTGGGTPVVLSDSIRIVVQDRGDGTGVNVTVSGAGPLQVVTAEIADIAAARWRDSISRTGNGVIVIPAGRLPENVTVDRAYYVRVKTHIGSDDVYTLVSAVQPTEGYASPFFTLMTIAKMSLIQENYAKLEGRWYHAIDPFFSLQAAAAFPAGFLHQPNSETLRLLDNNSTEVNYPLQVSVVTTNSDDWIADAEWWYFIRYEIYKRFNRFPVDQDGNSYGGRRWNAVFGPIGLLPVDENKYKYRFQSLILSAQFEHNLRGG